MSDSELRPLRPVRRYDVFAETKRLEALAHGEPEDVAEGYGIRIAKLVAARRFGGAAKPEGDAARHKAGPEPTPEGNRFREVDGGKFRALDGELQTDETFHREVIDRMGAHFYHTVFQPAVAEAVAAGQKYEAFRDTIRAEWKPAKPGSRNKSAPSG